MDEQQLLALAKGQSRVTELLEQLIARFDAFEARQTEANAAILQSLEGLQTRVGATNKGIDKLKWGVLSILIAQVGILITTITILLKLQ